LSSIILGPLKLPGASDARLVPSARTPSTEEAQTVSSTDDLLDNARAYATSFDNGDVPLRPARKVAVLACMDSRMDLVGLLGLELGDAHMIRNAGGVVTDDAIRSLAISQRMLGTEEIVLLHHTDCGMLTFSDDDFKRSLLDETGIKPAWAVEAFDDLDEDVRQSIARIHASPFIPNKDSVRGFVYDVHSGDLREIS
jgi:carbonic anhydrase